MEVSARITGQKEPTKVQYNFGNNLDEMVKLFGGDLVFNKALDALVIDAQSNVRRIIKKGLEHKVDGKPAPKTADAIQKEASAWAANWKPSAATGVRRSAAEKVGDLISSMSPEEKAKLLATLTGKK